MLLKEKIIVWSLLKIKTPKSLYSLGILGIFTTHSRQNSADYKYTSSPTKNNLPC
jgi:hypothetical protein